MNAPSKRKSHICVGRVWRRRMPVEKLEAAARVDTQADAIAFVFVSPDCYVLKSVPVCQGTFLCIFVSAPSATAEDHLGMSVALTQSNDHTWEFIQHFIVVFAHRFVGRCFTPIAACPTNVAHMVLRIAMGNNMSYNRVHRRSVFELPPV